MDKVNNRRTNSYMYSGTSTLGHLFSRDTGDTFSGSWGPFLESPGNFSGPKSNIQIEI